MTEQKKSLLGALILVVVFILVSGIIYAVSKLPVTANDLSSFVAVSPAVKLEELQDADGKFVLMDFPSDVDLSEYVTLGDYKHLTIDEIPVYTVSDEDIQDNFVDYVQYYKRYEFVTEGTVSIGDPITISYTGTLDGQVMDAYVAEERALQLGNANEPADFANSLHGSVIGEDLEFDVKMPDDWLDADVAGKTMHFTAHVFNKFVVPELTDDNVEYITDGEYHTAKEFTDFLRDQIALYYDQVREGEISDAILDKLNEICEFGTPDHKLLTWYVSILMKYYQDYADAQGMTIEGLIEYFQLSVSMDTLVKAMCEEAYTELPFQLVLTAVAQDAGITVDPEQDAELIALRKQYLMKNFGYETEDALLANYKESNVLHDVLNQKTIDWLKTIVQQVPAESAQADAGVAVAVELENNESSIESSGIEDVSNEEGFDSSYILDHAEYVAE